MGPDFFQGKTEPLFPAVDTKQPSPAGPMLLMRKVV